MAQFQAGQSGNPGGRPKENAEVKALAREYGPQAVATLAEIMAEGSARERVAAAVALLDRGYGKPAQSVALGNEDGKPFQVEEIVRTIVRPANPHG